MAKVLVIDMNQCDECTDCSVKCAYLYQPKVSDHGMKCLREQVAFMLVCRRCEEPSCAGACKFKALERQDDGVMKRYNMRCVSCKCCSHACPFGTIYPELVPLYAGRCDFCLSNLQKGEIACVSSCAKQAIEYRDLTAQDEKTLHMIGSALAVKSTKWSKKD